MFMFIYIYVCVYIYTHIYTHTHTMKHYLTTKRMLPFAITWLGLEGIRSEISHTEKDK